MTYLKLTTAMLAVLSLSACFGSDKDKTTEAPVVEPPVVVEEPVDEPTEEPVEEPVEVPATFNEKNAFATAITDAIADEVGSGDLVKYGCCNPQSGSANYAGFMTLPDPQSEYEKLLGEFDFDLDFATMDVTGKADNFSNAIDEIWSGNLDIDGNFYGKYDVDGVRFEGTLTSETGVETFFSAGSRWAVELYRDPDSFLPTAPKYIEATLDGYSITDEITSLLDGNDKFVGEITP